ncbi:MAG: protein-glutamate O-methyltransferase CheR [Deltaproteobacteria bacterium]|nr:protein-glutamate O-methyltransferase CheR [Deltaproteobacteria bacterium]
MYKITPEEYNVFTRYILEISGITLDQGKEYLVETRLGPILDDMSCTTFSELYYKCRSDKTGAVEKRIIDAIATNETYFFRDIAPFELLQHKIIPDLIDKRKALAPPDTPIKIRIWSAAAATGQEVYSITILLKELYLHPDKYNITLIGTDISGQAIARASYGRYNKFEISRGLSAARIKQYFDPDGDGWKIKDELRVMASFQKINLLKPLIGFEKFDIILCRNVAIYFTQKERQRLYNKIADVLVPDGYLLIGSTESLTNETPLFAPHKYLKSIFYQPKQ